jgi:NADPH-dependent curcumin reductase CurA
MSQTYRALELQQFARTLRDAAAIVDLPLRTPGPGEVAVRNTWAGVNGLFDVQIARNAVDYVKVGLPCAMGVEAVGVVETIGHGVTGLTVGDAVASVRFGGGYREMNIAPAATFVKVDAADPAALILASTGVSAHVALNVIGEAKAGETVAISAAAGGLGHILVQLAHAKGCKVIAICGGATKAAFVRELGADVVIDYRAQSVGEVLTRDYRDALDVAIDTVGGAIFDAFSDNLARHGRLVVGGVAQDMDGGAEVVTSPRIAHKLYYKAASVRGFMNGLLAEHWPAARAELAELVAAGKLKAVADAQPFIGLENVYDAVDWLNSGRSMGKVMVRL